MSLYLGLDAGGSATRWRLVDGTGGVLREGRVAPLTGLLFSERQQAAARAVLDELRSALGDVSLAGLVAGVTGLGSGTPAARTLAAMTAASLGLDVDRIRLLDDLEIAYHDAFAAGADRASGGGILVYAGTGSAAAHVTPDGEAMRAGGRGVLVDDAGGGFWIGREALRLVLREVDAGGAFDEGPLGAALARHLPGTTWPELRAHLYDDSAPGGQRGRMAALAPAVAEAANEGDASAVAILERAGSELADLATRLARRLPFPPPIQSPGLPLALAGGAARLHAALEASFAAALPPGTTWRQVEIVPVRAAAAQAARLFGPGHTADPIEGAGRGSGEAGKGPP